MLVLFLFLVKGEEPCSVEYKYDEIPTGYKLVHSTFVFKHGMRAPVDKIPGHETEWKCSSDNWLFPGGNSLNDELGFIHQFRIKPIEDQSFLKGSCRAGELLEEGFQQMKTLAAFLSKNYNSVLPSKFEKRRMSFRSTYTNRCLASLQALISTLFQGTEPIDVFVSNEELESLVPNSYICPAFEDIMNGVLKGNFSSRLAAFTTTLETIKTQQNITATPHWMRMGELLVTHKCGKMPLPGFDNDITKDSMNILIDFYKDALSTGKRLGSGVLLSEIYIAMRDYLSGGSDSSAVFVSGHTLTIMSLMAALDIELAWPPFGSMFAFEVLEKQDQFFVRVMLNGKSMKVMPLDDFRDKAMKMRPTEEECRAVYPFLEKNKKSMGIKMLQMSFS